jgi:hypothetical protein
VVPRSDEESDAAGPETVATPQEEWTPVDQRLPKSVTVEISLGGAGGEPAIHRISVNLPEEAQ